LILDSCRHGRQKAARRDASHAAFAPSADASAAAPLAYAISAAAIDDFRHCHFGLFITLMLMAFRCHYFDFRFHTLPAMPAAAAAAMLPPMRAHAERAAS